jgi:bidirectional [NiFe] hydrogenase diaphorase subunit
MNYEELQSLAKKESARQAAIKRRIYCCTSTSCLSSGSEQTLQSLNQSVAAYQCDDKDVEIVQIGCMGLCGRGPLVRVQTRDEPDVVYANVDAKVAQQLVAVHLQTDVVEADETAVDDHQTEAANLGTEDHSNFQATSLQTAGENQSLNQHILSPELPFFTQQVKVVLSDVGRLNPEKLEEYLVLGGYSALDRVLSEMSPEDVCQAILASGLRGRGGAGYTTALKWQFVLNETPEPKFIVANGDEGDPGAYMDRTIMEYNPHRVLEGMMIAAYAVGASYGYFYIRGEYPIAVKRMQRAIRAARRRGILGKSVMGVDFSFDAEIRIGAGAFVCGEETALMHSVEGDRGIPRMRPPYPSTSGLWGQPTVINNVETLANVPSIISQGADWYASIGTEKSKGTKVFALTGQLHNTGLIEVPMGITLREIVYDIGGGIPNNREFKAVQTGGPSGGCIPADFLDTPVDYESLKVLGSIMGSGGLVVIDDTTTMPEFARFFIDFSVDESCGKCLPCRVGTVQIRALLDKIIDGRAVPEDLDKLENTCNMVKKTSLCGLGQSAPNPVLSTLRYFRHEYDALSKS